MAVTPTTHLEKSIAGAVQPVTHLEKVIAEYGGGGGGGGGGSVTVDAALSASSENPVQNKAITNKINQMDSQLTDVKSQLDEKVSSKYETVNPKNWLDLEAIIDGEVLANGTVQSSTTRIFTDYIPVSEGDKVQAFRFNPISGLYRRHICLYDVEKNVVSGGSDSSTKAAFTIPSGVSFVRVTFDKNILTLQPMIVLDGEAPTTYSAYFEPYEELAEDFLTPESEAAVQKIIHGTLTTAEFANKYACAFVPSTLRQTVGLPETWYYASLANPLFYIEPSAGVENMTRYNDRVVLPNNTALDSVNGYACRVYDMLLNVIGEYTGNAGYGYPRKIVAENLANCSCLVIGDSTVDFDTMTQSMLDYFASKSKALTLLGTLGSGDNRNEGRSGWKATDYLTNKTYEGVVNPFYNPSTETFDFAYYMTNQGYSEPDFVVIQLGINDLYNYGLSEIEPTWAAIKTMIDSVRAYNSGIKILLNLPTTPNSDQSKHRVFLPSYQNRVVKYNEYAIKQCLALYGSNVRPTYCHLILDPATDIRDNVHPTNAGFEKMAKEVINQINCWQNGA